MAMGVQRWSVIAESQFPWEHEALEFLREHLPDQYPWHVWPNFEFVEDDGKVNEADALVLLPQGLFTVEIKSRPGILNGDTHSWTWDTDGRRYSDDNTLILANRKAKRLASLLRRQPLRSMRMRGARLGNGGKLGSPQGKSHEVGQGIGTDCVSLMCPRCALTPCAEPLRCNMTNWMPRLGATAADLVPSLPGLVAAHCSA